MESGPPGNGPQSPGPDPQEQPPGERLPLGQPPPQQAPPPGGYPPPPPPTGYPPPTGSPAGYPPPPQAPAPEQPPGAYPPQMPPGGWQAPPIPQRPAWSGAPLASWGSRAGALLLDAVVLLVVGIVLFLPGTIAAIADSGVAAAILFILGGIVYLVAAVVYAPYFMARDGGRNGQSLGKQWVGIRVVRNSGQPYDMGQAFLREFVVKWLLFGTVGGFFLYIPTLLDSLWPLWDDENRALHDMIVSSHVLQA